MVRVLVIDDSKSIRGLFRVLLEPIGYCVHEAENGKAGLETLSASGPFDIVFVDWNMPVMDGLQFVKSVRAGNCQHDVPIIVVTTENTMDHIAKAIEAGANEYVMKPFDVTTITEKLKLMGVYIA